MVGQPESSGRLLSEYGTDDASGIFAACIVIFMLLLCCVLIARYGAHSTVPGSSTKVSPEQPSERAVSISGRQSSSTTLVGKVPGFFEQPLSATFAAIDTDGTGTVSRQE